MEKRLLLGLAALTIGFKIVGGVPESSKVADAFRECAPKWGYKSPFKLIGPISTAIEQFSDKLLISSNFYLEIPLPLIPLERFRAILQFPFYKQ